MLAQWTALLVRRAGLSPSGQRALLASAGVTLEDLEAPAAHVDHDAVCQLWASLTEDVPSDFGARFAEGLEPQSVGLLGYLAAASDTVEDALMRVVRYSSLVKRPRTLTTTRTERTLSLVETPPRRKRPWPPHLTDAILGAYVAFTRVLTGVPVSAHRVRVTHAPPPEPHLVDAAFGCRVEFGAAVNELVLANAVLRLPIRTRDPRLLTYLEPVANASLVPEEELDRVRSHLATQLSAARLPSLASAARALAVSPRTLQRRLLEQGWAFRALVDDVRKSHAQRLVSDPHLNRSEVAYLLGFRDPSALRKAMRRWRLGSTDAARAR